MNKVSADCRPNDDLNENVNGQINVNQVTSDNGDDEESVITVDDAVTVNDTCDEFNESDPSSDPSHKDEHNVAASTLIAEQQQDKSLNLCQALAQRGKAGYLFDIGVLYRHERILGQEYEQLCLPKTRRTQAMKRAHTVYGGHLGAKKTKARLKLLFTWLTIATDVQTFCAACHECQKQTRVIVYNMVPITPIPRHDTMFQSCVMDWFGPIFPNQTNKT